MNREDFIAGLKKISPALARKDLVPILAAFCFCDDGTVMTYDGTVAMMLRLDLDGLAGGVRGETLLKWFQTFATGKKARTVPVKFEVPEGEVIFKSGRSKITLPVAPTSEFKFEAPAVNEADHEITITHEVITAIEDCVVSIGQDPANTWMLGVTIAFTKEAITFYSTDNFMLTRVEIDDPPSKDTWGHQFIMPPDWCNLFIELARKDKPITIYLHENWVQASFESGLHLFSRTVPDVRVAEYEEVFDQAKRQVEKNGTFPVPRGFEKSLDRALAVLTTFTDRRTTFTLRPKSSRKMKGPYELMLETASPFGVVKDRLGVSEEVKDLKVISHPDMMKKLAGDAEEMGLTKSYVYFEAASTVRLVTVIKE